MRILVFIVLFLPLAAVGQRDHIVSFRDKLVVTSVLNTKSESFDFTSSSDQNLEYSTADITGFGFGVDYKWLTFEFTKRLSSKGSDQVYGHTENFGIGFGFTMPKWYFRNFFEIYSGYHMTNPDFIDFNYLDSTGSYPYRPDISSVRYYASWNWVFNDENYSSMASLWQLERQEKSAGSWVAGGTYTYGSVMGDSAFIPPNQKPNFEQASHWREVSSRSMAANVGYQYTFVLSDSKKWFLHLGLTPGLGVNWSDAFDESEDDYVDLPTRAVFLTEGRFIVGYNGDQWYYGVSSIGYSSFAGGAEVSPVSNFNSYSRLYLGYRFTLPKKVEESLKVIGL